MAGNQEPEIGRREDDEPEQRPERRPGQQHADRHDRQRRHASGRLGRLLNGLPIVRITKSTSVCVASDSTNQPV